jgi:hypothetical protein
MKTFLLFFAITCCIHLNGFTQIQGDVIDSKDKGIPNAFVVAIDSVRNTSDTVNTDQRGFYEFKNLKPGKYKIEVKASGFIVSTVENIIVNEGDIGAVKGAEDLYRGQRLDIVLTPRKVSK